MAAQLPAPYAGDHGQAGFVVTAAEHVVIQGGAFAAFYSPFGGFGLLLQFGHGLHGGVGLVLPTGAGGGLVAAVVRAVDDFLMPAVAGAVVLRDVVDVHAKRFQANRIWFSGSLRHTLLPAA